jgi:DNA-binding response OmpR family regulator
MLGRPRILVVDDDSGIRDLIRTYLNDADHYVQMAKDGIEAMAKVAERRPDAIVLDINMPNMDGFAMLEALRLKFGHQHPPVLVLTARHSHDDVKRAVSLGAKDYLAKPFRKDQILLRVARLLHKAPAPAPPYKETAPLLQVVR